MTKVTRPAGRTKQPGKASARTSTPRAGQRKAGQRSSSARHAKAKVPTPRRIALARLATRRAVEGERVRRKLAYREAIRDDARQGRPRDAGSSVRTRSVRLVAEGDSWFDFPPHGLPPISTGGTIMELSRELSRRLGRTVPTYNMANAGDEVRHILGVDSRRRLVEVMSSPRDRPDALLFSGGGNDIVGEPMVLWLRDRDGSRAGDAVNPERFRAVLDLVMAGYEDLREIRDRRAPECVLFVHAYDRAIPSGRGVCGFGPWLRPALDARGWREPALARAAVQAMLEAFRERLQDFARADRSGRTVLVRTHALLEDNEWNDELHPSRSGFKKVARQFAEALLERFPGMTVTS
jgi:hypothetical protein